jgi:hypothetical protein
MNGHSAEVTTTAPGTSDFGSSHALAAEAALQGGVRASLSGAGLADRNRFLAKRIVEEARAGVHDRSLLKAAAIKGLGPATQH